MRTLKLTPTLLRVKPKLLTRPTSDADKTADDAWVESIKRQALANVRGGYASIRVAWTARFKIPRYPSFEQYTPEEALLELWEQFFIENPDHLENKGVFKRVNQHTGIKYYITGDPEIDAIEQALANGDDVDLSVLNYGPAPSIWREKIFEHTAGYLTDDGFGNVVKGKAGDKVSPMLGADTRVVRTDKKGETISPDGTRVKHTDFSSDAWLKDLEGDEFLSKFAAKHGVTDGPK